MNLIKGILLALSLFVSGNLSAQILIHSHNDYTHAHPFWGAYEQKANFIEADVFPVNGKLMVAHSKNHIQSDSTLNNMYLQPIIHLFQQHDYKTVSDNPHYSFYLMIDIKEKWDSVLPILMYELKQHPDCFDRHKNPMAVQIFISGDRPPENTFHDYPGIIMFDGLPQTKYSSADLKKVVEISTDFELYSHWNGQERISEKDATRLKQVIEVAHQEGKKIRFWGAPDTQDCWQTLINLGADIINTDHVKACRAFLDAHHL